MTQEEYLQILFNDCGFNNKQSHSFIESFWPDKHYISDLTNDQRSYLIIQLKALKERQG